MIKLESILTWIFNLGTIATTWINILQTRDTCRDMYCGVIQMMKIVSTTVTVCCQAEMMQMSRISERSIAASTDSQCHEWVVVVTMTEQLYYG
jgi:hypothetical protein